MIDDDEDIDDDFDEIDEQGEVVCALDQRRTKSDRDRALDRWFASVPLFVVETLLLAIDGKPVAPDVDRLARPYLEKLRAIAL